MEEMVTQGSVHSALTCLEESYFVGDVIIASSAVIGRGVVLRADPGCSITIRDGVCLGPGVIIHASQGAIELHQGVCLAGGVVIVGQGTLGRQVCVGSGATLINPELPDAAIVGADCLWGDESRRIEFEESPEDPELDSGEDAASSSESNGSAPAQNAEKNGKASMNHTAVSVEASHVTASTVIGKQQFELMLQKMFPEREAFKRSQSNSE